MNLIAKIDVKLHNYAYFTGKFGISQRMCPYLDIDLGLRLVFDLLSPGLLATFGDKIRKEYVFLLGFIVNPSEWARV